VAVSGTTYDISGLVNGTSYVFGVAAVNIAGIGTDANFNPIIPAGAPGVPTDVSGSFGNTTATISWNPPANLNGGTLRGYIVSINSQQAPITIDAATNTYTFPGLINGVSYTLSVKTYSSAGFSNPVSVTVTPGKPPGSPTGLTAAYAGSSGVLLNWVAPVDSGTGSVPVDRYRITYDSSAFNISGSTTFTAVGLTNGTLYTFGVTSINTVNLLSTPATIQWTPATSPTAPSPVTATAGIRSASLSWGAPNNNGSAITSYTVMVSSSNGGSLGTIGTISGTSCTVTGLTDGKDYTFTVTATNAAGTSAAGTSNTITLAGLPGIPVIQTPTQGDTQVTVNWSAPSSNGSAITTYYIQPYAAGSLFNIISTASTATSYTVTNLTNGTSYTFSVAAVNGVGTGSYSSQSSPVTPAGLPGPPNITSTPAGDTQVTVNWSAPTSNGSTISNYSIQEYIGGSFNRTITTGSAATSYTVTGLTNGTSYTFSVAAVNGVGTGSYSSQSSPVTPASLPDPPNIISPGIVVQTRYLDNGQFFDKTVYTQTSITAPSNTGGSAIKYYTCFCIHNSTIRTPSDTLTEGVPINKSIYLSSYTPNGNFYVTATNTAGYTSLPRICNNLTEGGNLSTSIGTDSSLSYSSPVNINSITYSTTIYDNGMTWSNLFSVNFTPISNMLYYTVVMDGYGAYPLTGNSNSTFGVTTSPIYIDFVSTGQVPSGTGPFTFRISCTNTNISTSKLSAPFTFLIP
jgi:hypothetical protein